MMSILVGTPIWVWLLLAYTVRAGIRASRQRTVRPSAVAVLPFVLLAISLWHVMQGEAGSVGAICWILGLISGGTAGWCLGRRLYLRREGGLLCVSGSWLVLATSIFFFGVHYWLGYQQAVA
uniref:hypothetical protein n=1 Tax=Teichococcus vastitatis TaxID=2307076 RepID=UPI000E73710E